ncbi:MAG: hypothetical protein GY759_24065, partial [Chloroflexi bacterium]|nr:hypothetical protein [Chloroflexota bacterium]
DDAIDITVTGNTVLFTEDAGATTSLFSSTIDTIETTDTITQVILTMANVESGDTLSFGATDIDLNTNGATVAGGFTYTVSSAGVSPVVTITHAGTDDATVNTMLNSLVFNNTTNNDPSTTARTVTLTSVTDSGSGTTADGTVATVNVAKADDAIDITVTGNTVLFTEDSGATTSLFSSTIDTIETGDTITQIILTMANVESGDTLSFGATDIDLNTNGATVASGFTYTVSSAGATPIVTITHAGTDDATVNTMLNSLVFNNTTNNDPGTTARTVTLTSVTDSGSGLTADGTVATVNVTTANDVSTISNLAGDGLAYSEGDRAVVIEQGSDVVVADVDSTDFDTGTLTVSFTAGSDSAEDILGIRNQGYGAGEISIAGWGVAYGGTLIGSFEGGANGDDLVITLNASATPAAVQALIENITYENTDRDNATTGARTVRFVLNDGDGGTSANYDTTVTVSAANHAPTFFSVTGDGSVTTDFGSGDDIGAGFTLQSDGKMLAIGKSWNGSDDDFALTRYNTDGSLDTTFGGGDGIVTTAIGSGDDRAKDVTVQSDGKILVTGLSHNGTDWDFALTRYNSDGTLDTSFGGGDGILTTAIGAGDDSAVSVTMQSDGKILVAGNSDNGSDKDLALVRYNTDGSLDTSFDGDGILTTAFGSANDSGSSVAVQSNGKILVAGTSFNGSDWDFSLARYNTDGSLDTSFDGDGKLTTGFTGDDASSLDLNVLSDGRILLAGYVNI